MQANGTKAIAIINPDFLNDLQKQGMTMRMIAQDPRRISVTNYIK